MIRIIKSILPKNRTYYFAVSMGVDSVAAASFMINKGYRIIPVHFNHGLRPQNELMMYKFLDFCKDLDLKGFVAKGQNLKTEAECRKARLEFYKDIANNGLIITAHHLNDWVESYLLNCFRGHPNHDPFYLVSNFTAFSIIHPFLLSRKKDFIEYLDRNNLTRYTIVDETNEVSEGSRRNWIRNIIIPNMKSNKVSLEKFAKRQITKLIKEYDKSSDYSSIG